LEETSGPSAELPHFLLVYLSKVEVLTRTCIRFNLVNFLVLEDLLHFLFWLSKEILDISFRLGLLYRNFWLQKFSGATEKNPRAPIVNVGVKYFVVFILANISSMDSNNFSNPRDFWERIYTFGEKVNGNCAIIDFLGLLFLL
jgi:hypothetical protein